MVKYKLINESLYNKKAIFKLANIIGKKVSSVLLAGTLLFTGCSNALAKPESSSNSMKVACVMGETYSSSKTSAINSTPSIKTTPTPIPSTELGVCTEFDWIDVNLKDITVAIAKINGEEKVLFVETHFDKEDNTTLMDEFSFNTMLIEKYNKKKQRIEFFPINIMKDDKVEAIERTSLELYFKGIGMSEQDVLKELSKIRLIGDLRKLYESRVPKEQQVILPLFIPEDEYTKNENRENYAKNKQKVKGLQA